MSTVSDRVWTVSETRLDGGVSTVSPPRKGETGTRSTTRRRGRVCLRRTSQAKRASTRTLSPLAVEARKLPEGRLERTTRLAPAGPLHLRLDAGREGQA